jgi:DNA (cytosine-5)-methyltransferase 1
MSLSPKNYSVVSLFSGAGGLDLGFEAAGFRLLEAIDINAWCVQTLKKNRPNWKVILGDVRNYDPQEKPDVLLAGVPCQGFSLGGRRQENDLRNLLYKEVIPSCQNMPTSNRINRKCAKFTHHEITRNQSAF